jgi:hypothetical protein
MEFAILVFFWELGPFSKTCQIWDTKYRVGISKNKENIFFFFGHGLSSNGSSDAKALTSCPLRVSEERKLNFHYDNPTKIKYTPNRGTSQHCMTIFLKKTWQFRYIGHFWELKVLSLQGSMKE